MRQRGRVSAFFLLLLLARPFLCAEEYSEGLLKLVLYEDSGAFSLYGEQAGGIYLSLFSNQNPKTSFLTLVADKRSFRLGDSAGGFRFRSITGSLPAFIYESASFSVTETFSFTKTPGSSETNALRLTFTVENRGPTLSETGIFFILDTSLGERPNQPHFLAGHRPISRETAIPSGEDRWWISRNGSTSLQGTIPEKGAAIFANWRRLSEPAWQGGSVEGRNFSFPPYSIDDSAVCLWFEPAPLSRGETRTYSLLLAFDKENRNFNDFGIDEEYQHFLTNGNQEDFAGLTRERALSLIKKLLETIEERINQGTITNDEYTAMSRLIERLKLRFGSP